MASIARPGETSASRTDPDRVYGVVDARAATLEDVERSWRRSLRDFRLDPGSREAPRILTVPELRESRGPVEELIAIAQKENDRLHAIVSKVGYAVLFTSPDGVVVDYRGDPNRAEEFRRWGTYLGGVWSEDVEGTNGIGTCIAEQRPVTVHRAQHFRARNTSLSCCGAPIFNPKGQIAAVLDVTSIDPEVSDRSHALALAVTIESAHAIEERLFRQSFRRAWTLAVALPLSADPPFMLAVDDDQRILGADRNARLKLAIDDSQLAAGISLWAFFDRSPSHFLAGTEDLEVQMTRLGDAQSWRVLVTPPERRATVDDATFHVRPRTLGQTALSPREHSILELIGQGRSNKEIARSLGVSPETVKSHIKNMFLKLGVERRAQAILKAQVLGIRATA